MQHPSTSAQLSAARDERRYLVCGGESKFSNIGEADAEIQRLHRQLEEEERADVSRRRDALHGEMVEAVVARDVLYWRWQEAKARYERLAKEAAAIDRQLKRSGAVGQP